MFNKKYICVHVTVVVDVQIFEPFDEPFDPEVETIQFTSPLQRIVPVDAPHREYIAGNDRVYPTDTREEEVHMNVYVKDLERDVVQSIDLKDKPLTTFLLSVRNTLFQNQI